MEHNFYYIGFFYILNELIAIFKYFKPIKNPKSIIIEDGMGAGALMSEADKYLSDKKRDKKSIPVLLASILFFVWIIVGYLYNTPEKYLFLTDLIFILSVYAALTIIAIVFSFRAMFGIKVKQYNVIPKDPLNINLILLCSPVEILIVSLILFNHFFK